MKEFDFKTIEEKWQKKWEDARIFEVKEKSDKPNYYVLEMFPYPSGSGLHMGHAWNYIIGDILARFKLMKGFNVLYPPGYDSLGLPAENAAIKVGAHPEEYTNKAIKNFIRQQKGIGLSYDWSRMIITSKPEYYKWDQWIFLKMFEKGLAYQKKSNVNWCPSCKTVLANEQAQTGNCDRCDARVETKYLRQWFLKITDYADELYEGLNKLEDWPERTKLMQKNWIGKSKGTEIDFNINGEKWPVFTTRPDTLFGVTFMVISAQHSKLINLVTKEQEKEVGKFLKKLKSVSEKDVDKLNKEGVFTGSYALNPLTNEKVPIYAGNFVVADYGSGMVMAVPAHDKRDFEFAKKYNILIREVVKFSGVPQNVELRSKDGILKEAYVGEGVLMDSGMFSDLKNKEAKEKITDFLIDKKIGRRIVQFRLKDWGISRQRYWGTPIPIIYCDNCGIVPVNEKDLPIELPKKVKFGEGNPLETNEEWINVDCPRCGGKARRETDTMDTFVNSSWYFLRYCDPKNYNEIFDKKKVKQWCPVDSYIGGAEHACMHLIYSRFYTKFLRDLGLLNFDEPFKKLFHQGMLHNEGGGKMSKSKGKIVLPESVSNKYGLDTARFFLSSLASPDKDIDWSEKGILGSLRFIKRIFEYFENLKIDLAQDTSNKLNSKVNSEVKLNKTIKNISEYYENFEYRKATIELRELFELIESKKVSKETFELFLKLLNPICPHITEELWDKLGNKNFISNSSWPEFDENKLIVEKKEIDLTEKIIGMIKPFLGKKVYSKIYLYFVPNEFDKVNKDKLEKEFGISVFIYNIKDKQKYDPQNKSKKARPGQPGFYLE
ncbi:MAG: leucine--tRNA ligase [Nanoarchaeota archaeon]|nr:leucine--tRNA ligase [Nanoarchaeota archaeon]